MTRRGESRGGAGQNPEGGGDQAKTLRVCDSSIGITGVVRGDSGLMETPVKETVKERDTRRTINVRKNILILALAVTAFMVLMVTPAFAGRLGGYWAVSGGVFGTFSRTSGAPTFIAAGGPSHITPHQGYATTTGKCKVCHAVHGAGIVDVSGNITTERLLRSDAADSCSFCHLTNAYATNPYGAAINYTAEIGSGHWNEHEATATIPVKYEGCVSCHSVHGGATIPGSHILKNDPARGVTSELAGASGGWGSFTDTALTTQAEFCQDCHDGTQTANTDGTGVTPINTEAQFRAQFTSCGQPGSTGANCHNSASPDVAKNNTQFGVTFNKGHDGRSHPMTTGTTGYGGIQTANIVTRTLAEDVSAAGNSCTTCHNVNQDIASGATFPHWSPDQELIAGYTATTQIDGVCLRCHQWNGTEGVSKTF